MPALRVAWSVRTAAPVAISAVVTTTTMYPARLRARAAASRRRLCRHAQNREITKLTSAPAQKAAIVAAMVPTPEKRYSAARVIALVADADAEPTAYRMKRATRGYRSMNEPMPRLCRARPGHDQQAPKLVQDVASGPVRHVFKPIRGILQGGSQEIFSHPLVIHG